MGDYAKENYVHTHSLAWRSGHIYTTLFREHIEHMGRRVLQIGCNAGTTLAYLAREIGSIVGWTEIHGITVPSIMLPPAKRRYAGWDINPLAVEAARDLLSFEDRPVVVRHRDVCLETPHAGIADTVLMLDVLEHIWPADQGRLQRSLHRILAPGGKLWLYCPRAWSDMDVSTPSHVAHFGTVGEMIDAACGSKRDGWRVIHEHYETRPNPDPRVCPGKHDGLFAIVERI